MFKGPFPRNLLIGWSFALVGALLEQLSGPIAIRLSVQMRASSGGCLVLSTWSRGG